jgi:signal transduction histidine kinase/ABC-type phosphate/phosphonate transport system substrate-binding protein
LLVVLWAAGNAQAHEHRLTWGVFAYMGQEQTLARYQPLTDYLNESLKNIEIELRVLPQTEIEAAIFSGELDMVTTNPTHFLVVRKKFPLTGVMATLVNQVDGRPVHHLAGAIVTRADTDGITTLSDIRGKTIGIPSFKHMGGFRSQAYELHKAGIQLPEDVKAIVPLELHENVIQAVLDGRVDVGFVRDGVLEAMIKRGQLSPDALTVINEKTDLNHPFRVSTRLYPEWPVFALPHVPEEAIRQVAAALFSLESGHPAAKAAKVYGYTIPADYLVVEELARSLRLPPFDHAPEFTWADVQARYGPVLWGLALAIVMIMALVALLAHSRKRIAQQHERLKAIMDGVGAGIYIVDMKTHAVLFANAFIKAQLGDVEGRICWQTFHKGMHGPCDFCNNADLLDANGNPLEKPIIWEHFNTQVGRWLELHDKAIPWDDGRFVRMEMAIDITERKRLSDQMTHLLSQLKHSNEELEQFAYAASHDLRQPLRMVTSYIGLLEKHLKDQLDPDAREMMHFASDGAKRMDQMLVSLLEYSRVGRKGEPMTPLHSHEALDEALLFLKPLIEEANAHITVLGEWPTLVASRDELTRLFQNLIGNALKYRDPQRTPQVTIRVSPLPTGWRFEVSDNGIGIDPAQFDRLFKVFQRLHARSQYEGTGIGLAVARKIVERHGGRISVHSEGHGFGCTFRFNLPFSEEAIT